VGLVTYFARPNLIRMGKKYVSANAGIGGRSGCQSSAGKLQSLERADSTVPEAGSFPTRGLVSLGCRRFSTGKNSATAIQGSNGRSSDALADQGKIEKE
jgi:hypothetical protein